MRLYNLNESIRDQPVDKLYLDARSKNVFAENGIETIGDIIDTGILRILQFKNMGLTSARHICILMRNLGIPLEDSDKVIQMWDEVHKSKELNDDNLREYMQIASAAIENLNVQQIEMVLDKQAIRLFGKSLNLAIGARKCIFCDKDVNDPDRIYWFTGLCKEHRNTKPFPGRPTYSLPDVYA